MIGTRTRFPRRLSGYLVAVTAFAISCFIRWSIARLYGEFPPFITFYPVVLLVAIVCDIWVVLLSTAFSALVAIYWTIPPQNQFEISRPSDVIGLALFCMTGIFVSVVAELYHRERKGLVSANAQLRMEVVERKRAEEALRTSEEKFARAFNNNPAAVALTRLEDGVFVEVNDTWAELVGYCREEMIDRSARKMNIYPTPEIAAQFVRELRERGSLHGWERELLKKSGAAFVAELSAQILTVDGEKLILTTLVDVTARKRAEKALRESESRFRAFFETAAVGTAELDLQGRFMQVNERFCQITGYGHEELLGMTAAELTHPEDRDLDLGQIEACLQGRLPIYDAGKRYLRKDGRVIWVHVTAAMIRDTEGKLLCSAGIVEDITERKCAEEALRESESKFRALFQHSPDAVFMTIPDGHILAANPAACAMFGMSESDFRRVGRETLVDRDDPRYIAALEERQRKGLVTKTELFFIRRSGERFPGEVDSVVVPGSPPKSFVIVRDITVRKQAEEALIRSEKLASVGRMAATVAHEINNPLEAVTNALYLAKGAEGLPELAREVLELADAELNRVAHIARQSLGFYRESNAPSALSIKTVLESVLDLLRNRIQAKKATVKMQVDDDLYLTAVGGELRQVFSNLLANSLDAIERNGTIILRVSTVVTLTNQRCVRVTISDSGKGIGANLRSQIFEPFFTTKGTVGTGLGLWVSKQIVDNHGGTIRVRSNTHGPRRGTTISVLLPDTPSAEAGSRAPGFAAGS